MTIHDISVIRGTCLAHFSELTTELGGDPATLLAAQRIEPDTVGQHDAFISLTSVMNLLEETAAATETPAFSRELSSRQSIDILGPVGVAARTAPSVGEAMATIEAYLSAYSPAIAIEISPLPDPARALYEFRFLLDQLPRHTQSNEQALGVTLQVFKYLVGPEFAPLTVHFPHDALSDPQEYVDYFRAPVLFADRITGFTVRSADLAQPIDPDPATHQALVAYLDGVIAENPTGITPPVRDLVTRLLPTGAGSLDLVAGQLAMHPRTLQRRLAEEGTSFAAILDDVRRGQAERYLRDTELTLSHLARELGYTEQSALTRSCRRWFGSAPAAYRVALRA